MSYSFEGNFRTKETARRNVMKAHLPDVVRALLNAAINGLSYDTDDRFIYVKANGHQLDPDQSNGGYERTSADILVEPRFFTLDRP